MEWDGRETSQDGLREGGVGNRSGPEKLTGMD